jgi:hypothetical protein
MEKYNEIWATNFEAEVGILGGLLAEELYQIDTLGLTQEDFDTPLHKDIFAAMLSVYNKVTIGVSWVLVNNELIAMGKGNQSQYLFALAERAGHTGFIKKFVQLLKNYSNAKKIQKEAERIISLMNSAKPDFSSIADVLRKITDITSSVSMEKIENEASPTEDACDFPLEVFPAWLQNFCSSVQKSIGVPVDFPAVAALSCASTLVGKKIEIQIKKDWKESARLYIAVVANPSSGKSPALKKCFAPIFQIEEQLHKENTFNKNNFQEEMEKYEVEKEEWKKNSKKGTKVPPPQKPEEPKINRLYTTDFTVESLVTPLADGNSLVIYQDELTQWVNGLNAYKTGKGKDKDFFLSNWSGTPIVIDRKKDKTQYIPNPFIGVIGGITPENLTSVKGEVRDGWASRILFSYPEPIMENFSDYSIPDSVSEEYSEKMNALFKGSEKILTLSNDARKIFSEYYNFLKKESYEHSNPWVSDALGKMPGYFARFILLLHCLENAGQPIPEIIDEECVYKASRIIDYFKQHAKKVYFESTLSEEDKQVSALLTYLQKKGGQNFLIRDLCRNNVAGCKNVKQVKALVSLVIERGRAVWKIKDKEFLLIEESKKQ